MSALERTVHRYRLKGSNITFMTSVTLDAVELGWPIVIEREDVEKLGTYEIKAVKKRE